MFFLLPYGVDVTMYRWPIANFILIATISMVSIAAVGSPPGEGLDLLTLRGMGLVGLFGHVFLHGSPMHLIGNMLFLWSFGNAVCAKVGNWTYLGLFFLLAALSGTVHNLFSDAAVIGASGAINGIVGLFIVFFPRNDVRCFWVLFLVVFIRTGTFGISSFWMILLWLGFDIWGVASDSAGVAYWAHLGGFFSGLAIGILSLKRDWVKMTETECSLLDVLDGRR